MRIVNGGVYRLTTRKVQALSEPRYIAGGAVVLVTWATDDDAPDWAHFADGTLHPVHAHGFKWEEPVCNLQEA